MPIRWQGGSSAPLYNMVITVSDSGLCSWKLLREDFALLFEKDVHMRWH